MIAVSRFRVPGDPSAFRTDAEAVATHFAGRPGCLGAELVRNLDEPELWALISRWADVGSYRRAFSGVEARMLLIPLLSRAIDEPSAYADPTEAGRNLPRGTLG